MKTAIHIIGYLTIVLNFLVNFLPIETKKDFLNEHGMTFFQFYLCQTIETAVGALLLMV